MIEGAPPPSMAKIVKKTAFFSLLCDHFPFAFIGIQIDRILGMFAKRLVIVPSSNFNFLASTHIRFIVVT